MENITTNDLSEILDSFYFYENEQLAVLWILFIAIVSGNCGVLYMVFKKRVRNHRMNYFITHLAMADLLVGLVNVLTDIIWRFTISWYLGNVACKIIKYLQVVITYGSTYILVALSIDRYDAIKYPMKFSDSWRKAKFLIWTAWSTSLMISVPIIFLYKEKEIQGQPQCWIEFPEEWHWRLYMTLVSLSLFIMPALIISSCYLIIILIIRSKSRKFLPTKEKMETAGFSGGIISKAKVKTVKISLVIVTVFVLCWSPYIIFDLLQVYGFVPHTQTNIAIATFIQSLTSLNSAANPLIYFISSTRSCRMFRKLPCLATLGCAYRRRRLESISTTMQTSSKSEFLTTTIRSKFEY